MFPPAPPQPQTVYVQGSSWDQGYHGNGGWHSGGGWKQKNWNNNGGGNQNGNQGKQNQRAPNSPGYAEYKKFKEKEQKIEDAKLNADILKIALTGSGAILTDQQQSSAETPRQGSFPPPPVLQQQGGLCGNTAPTGQQQQVGQEPAGLQGMNLDVMRQQVLALQRRIHVEESWLKSQGELCGTPNRKEGASGKDSPTDRYKDYVRRKVREEIRALSPTVSPRVLKRYVDDRVDWATAEIAQEATEAVQPARRHTNKRPVEAVKHRREKGEPMVVRDSREASWVPSCEYCVSYGFCQDDMCENAMWKPNRRLERKFQVRSEPDHQEAVRPRIRLVPQREPVLGSMEPPSFPPAEGGTPRGSLTPRRTLAGIAEMYDRTVDRGRSRSVRSRATLHRSRADSVRAESVRSGSRQGSRQRSSSGGGSVHEARRSDAASTVHYPRQVDMFGNAIEKGPHVWQGPSGGRVRYSADSPLGSKAEKLTGIFDNLVSFVPEMTEGQAVDAGCQAMRCQQPNRVMVKDSMRRFERQQGLNYEADCKIPTVRERLKHIMTLIA